MYSKCKFCGKPLECTESCWNRKAEVITRGIPEINTITCTCLTCANKRIFVLERVEVNPLAFLHVTEVDQVMCLCYGKNYKELLALEEL